MDDGAVTDQPGDDQIGNQTGPSDNEVLEGEIVSMLEKGQKIKAIKHCRERFGIGLKEAKDAVESIAAKHNFDSKAGCGAMVIVAVGLASLVVGRVVYC